MTATPGEPAYWQAVYDEGEPGWDRGAPAPPLERALGEFPLPRTGAALVPGCGFGHEALMLARLGYAVTAVDFAPAAIAGLRARAGAMPLTALERDLFSLGGDFSGGFDLVVEHTCFCAIPIERRGEYAALMAQLLRPEGWLLGLFYETDRGEGPPFCTTRGDVERHFLPFFEILHLSRPSDSFAGREGKEWLGLMRKRPA
ncbi:MAG: methyltransferase domain-containing protein [Candidatus Handelsmanbacteria bacterium]|nr:methyltransferase domain-containing protein [Candidatus Handelsmanbacteria bacterium]